MRGRLTGECWVDFILAWHLAGINMDPHMSELFLATITSKHLDELDGTLYEEFLPEIANGIVGAQMFEATKDRPIIVKTTQMIARAIAFGSYESVCLPDYVTCAREACYLMQSVDLVPAVHSLVCLTILHRTNLNSIYHPEIEIFILDSRRYLDWVASAIDDSRLNWELQIWYGV
jgi:hypothetical protein